VGENFCVFFVKDPPKFHAQPPPTTRREGISQARDKEKEMKESILCPLETLTQSVTY
jgi:hypothetical protein